MEHVAHVRSEDCLFVDADLIDDEVVLGLEDGRAFVYSCEQIAKLEPVRVVYPEKD